MLHVLGTLARGETMLVHPRVSLNTPIVAPFPPVFFGFERDSPADINIASFPAGVFFEGDCLITAT